LATKSSPAEFGSTTCSEREYESGISVIEGEKFCFLRLPDGLRVYMNQKVSWAGIALSLL